METLTDARQRADARLLVVEDEPNILELLSASLRYAGFDVVTAAAGTEAVQAAQRHRPDLIVLDVMLPDMDGFDVIRRLRGGGARIPVVFLTARDATEDKIRGLTLGGDDYVTKPFSPRELALRVRSVLRRARGTGLPESRPEGVIADGDLTVDLTAHEVRVGKTLLSLTSREYDLLVFLMQHPRKAFTREQLLNQVWSWTFGDTSTVTVHVRRLREKLESDPTMPRRIVTVWGVGYRYEPGAD
jgi:DNA-binding response OmpR family regulator